MCCLHTIFSLILSNLIVSYGKLFFDYKSNFNRHQQQQQQFELSVRAVKLFTKHSFTTLRKRRKTGQGGGEAQVLYYQYHHHYPPPSPTPNSYRARGGEGKQSGRTSENSVTLSLTLIQISTSNFRSRMQALKVNKSSVQGNNFDTEVVHLVSVIRVIRGLLNHLLS